MLSFERILCPVDLSDASRRAHSYAVALSTWYSAPLTVLHAVANVPMFESTAPFGPLGTPPVMMKNHDVEKDRAELRRFMGSAADTPSIEIVVEMADICTEILRQALDRKVDLIVMGTLGHTGLRLVLLGSVAEHVVRLAPCPVLTVKDVPTGARSEAGRGATTLVEG